MATSSKYNYTITVGTTLDMSGIQKALRSQQYHLKVQADGTKDVEHLNSASQDLAVTYQQLQQVFSATMEIMSKMSDQVFELDESITEFRKVSELSGAALDDYVDKIADLGKEVGRTGKPNRSEPVCTDGKCA